MAEVDEFAERLERVADRLRSLGESRLVRTGPAGEASPADQAARLAGWWARLVAGPDYDLAPVSAFGVGDQLLVIGRDLVGLWRRGGLAAADQTAAADGLEALRRAI